MNRLAVSNIAWSGSNSEILSLLASLGVSGIEVAPSKIMDGWTGLDLKTMDAYRRQCEDFGLVIPSFQAFLFNKPELQLLGSFENFEPLRNHVDFVAELAATAGAKILVYGAPRSRLLFGRSLEEVEDLCVDRLGLLAETCAKHHVSLGLEAVPPEYGGEIITSFRDSIRIVGKVNSPSLVLHLDSGCTWLNGDDVEAAISAAGKSIFHFHISQPQLADFSSPAKYHTAAANMLRSIEYSKWCCIEMRETEQPLVSLEQAVIFVKSTYG